MRRAQILLGYYRVIFGVTSIDCRWLSRPGQRDRELCTVMRLLDISLTQLVLKISYLLSLTLDHSALFLYLGYCLLLVLVSDLLHPSDFAFLAFNLAFEHQNDFIENLSGARVLNRAIELFN